MPFCHQVSQFSGSSQCQIILMPATWLLSEAIAMPCSLVLTPSPLLHGKAGFLNLPKGKTLDTLAMHEAAQVLVGEHDFSSFRSSECQSKTPIKTLYQVSVIENGPWVYFVFRGNAFLHHMVRNLVGSLLLIGAGKEPVTWMSSLLAAKKSPIGGRHLHGRWTLSS